MLACTETMLLPLPFPLEETADTLVLCATARAAQHLRQQHAQASHQAGLSHWPTLRCVPLPQWLQRVREDWWLGGLPADDPLGRELLDPAQSQWLWEQAMQEDLGPQAPLLFDLGAMARSAEEADALTVTWHVDPGPAPWPEETRRFLAWQARFVQRCERAALIDAARLQRAVVARLDAGHTPVGGWPRRLFWAGFNRYDPVARRLQAAAQDAGVDVAEWPGAPIATQVQVLGWPDAWHEAQAAAQWVQRHWAAQPQAQLAIIVPDLQARRDLLQDVLEDLLCPAVLHPAHAEAARPFNITLGLPLARQPLVACALQLLQLALHPHDVALGDASELLLNPYWSANEAEACSRAALQAHWRRSLPPRTRLERLLSVSSQWAEAQGESGAQWWSHLATWAQQTGLANTRQRPSEWARALPPLLQALGWLQGRRLSSHEFQALQAWQETLQALPRLEGLAGRLDGRQLLVQLRRLCQQRVFQPQTEGAPKLQVLGLLEAGGLRFDAVWVMGMEDAHWPPPARPNPLLPTPAQRLAQSPNASAAGQQAYALQQQAGLLRTAPEVVFSWAKGDGSSTWQASPLLPAVRPSTEATCPPVLHWVAEAAAMAGKALAEPIDDTLAPPWPADTVLRGGTAMLRAQALCPAWAFFQYRLGAKPLEEPADGLDSRQRGSLLHKALQHFWTAMVTGERLQASTEQALAEAIDRAVDAALNDHALAPRAQPLGARARRLEQGRLQRLLQGWLALERQRPEGFAVLACEASHQLNLRGLRVDTTLDRLDQLPDGRLLVVDYKTGSLVPTRSWSSGRLFEPQLPLYAAMLQYPQGPVAGVAFAHVRLREPKWHGLAADSGVLPGLPALDQSRVRSRYEAQGLTQWSQVLWHWQDGLNALAQEVLDGSAAVRVTDEALLRYCEVLPLLRLDERRRQWEDRHGA